MEVQIMRQDSQELLRIQATEVLEMIEDCVESICDEKRLSGEKVWVMINALSVAKINEFPYQDDNNEWVYPCYDDVNYEEDLNND